MTKPNPKRIIDYTDVELEELMKRVVKETFTSIEPKKEEEDELLSRYSVSQLLKVSLVTVWRYTTKKLLQSKKIGRRIFYSKRDILSFQQSR